MFLLKQNTSKKGQVNKLLEPELEFNVKKNKEYKVETIKDNAVYAIKDAGGQLSELYYLDTQIKKYITIYNLNLFRNLSCKKRIQLF